MVITSLLKNILPIAAVGLGLAFLYNVIAKPAQAQESTNVISNLGTGLGSSLESLGGGVQSLLTGIGTGSAQLLNPLFTLKTLIYGDEEETIEIEQIENATNTTNNNPIINTAASSPGVSSTPAQSTSTISWSSSGKSATVPALSPAAKSYYAARGVSVSWLLKQ